MKQSLHLAAFPGFSINREVTIKIKIDWREGAILGIKEQKQRKEAGIV